MRICQTELASHVAEIIETQFIGLLATVDQQMRPRMRYMNASLLGGDIRSVYTITPAGSAKIAEISHHPAVCWTFADDEYDNVVTLHGHAAALPHDEENLALITKHLNKRKRCYLTPDTFAQPGEKLIVLRTTIERIEWSKPHENPPQNLVMLLAEK